MKPVYTILLPNEKAKTYKYITLFILLINCLVFGFVFFNTAGGNMKNISLIGAVISIISLVFFLINLFTGKLPSYRSEISFIILAVCWLILGHYLLALCVSCFAFIGIFTARKFNVLVSETEIVYPSFPVKKYSWHELNQVMLKDNILTIDLANNKLIQAVISKESADGIDEYSFNEFCKKSRLNAKK